ncbi:MAG: serine/threonine protein phosphatase [Clostridiales bacterium 43-6]|nr:MAG: serine/threonine protein phosphatase [Clostridiales bacterium 43-6]
MSLFAIADLHLSLGTDKPMDVFKGWTDYISRLEKNWRAIVKEQDVVVIPGDISWAMRLSETVKDFALIHSLPGKKLFLKGNHDYWWATMQKMQKFLIENGFTSIDFVHNNAVAYENYAICGTRGWFFDAKDHNEKVILREAARLQASIDAAKARNLIPVVFLHYPPVTKDQVCDEIFSVLVNEKIERCYYGHIHGAGCYNAVNGIYEGVKFSLVSCDFLEFLPLKIL